ncbi:hypothetical protein BU24DRAFT_1062 [Aaosphaeria arxii CBS 175.79]|uniref:Uncharacterized protein n=1 Tax=Aaosphaeria arxii CBS 175.79 TaxID=1450172 RepID=A0A6A5Y6R1_9PLEO|nr:uncharacterized protein BU24DRAFT_1062 [Aaosphaeria arxii CBS 175.79]KAF2020431.1 hypothetical protein BU24DRAFT_1062 [Aaosphaeria arxii CBS 175.79]
MSHISSSRSPPKSGSRFEEQFEQYLGIHMNPIQSPASPNNTYHLKKPQPHVEGVYDPLPGNGSPPMYPRTPHPAASFLSRSRTDPMTQRLIQHRATQAAKWKIHWRTPALMASSFLLGFILVLGQHFLYRYLHHRVEHNEDKRIRWVLYGRAMAYFSKITFGGCVILCYRQRIWRTMREQPLSIMSIDQLFLATEDPSLFANWETLTQAKLPVLMALAIWLIPLATIIFSPGALTFGDIYVADRTNLMVPTLNFTAESYKDYRKPVYAEDGTKKKSLVFMNTTDPDGLKEGFFDYYDQPSADVQRVTLMAAYSLKNQSLNREDARIESCGGEYNCTYSINFVAPGYKCELVAEGPQDHEKLKDMHAPFNTSLLAPEGRHVYWAQVDDGNYASPQSDNLSNRGGVPEGPVSDDFGVFETEPVLWIGYSVDSNETLPENSRYKDSWKTRFDPRILRCVHYETEYNVDFNYSGPFFTTNIDYKFLAPVIDTNLTRYDENTTEILPAENFVDPRKDVLKYKKTAAYHAMGERLRYFLRGSMVVEPQIPGPFFAKVYSQIAMTRLVSNTSSIPVEGLPTLVQQFYAEMILSLFSVPNLLVVSEQQTRVRRRQVRSTFIYDHWKLWASYAPVIFFVLIFLLLGFWTIWEDGVTFSVGFSRIMVTTRNTTLDEISRGACLGNDPFPPELMHTRLKFGVLSEGGHELEYMGIGDLPGAGHCAFGVPSEVGPIRKGIPYAGLQVRRQDARKRKEKEKTD